MIGGFAVEAVGDETHRVTMTFDWAGISPDSTDLAAETQHI